MTQKNLSKKNNKALIKKMIGQLLKLQQLAFNTRMQSLVHQQKRFRISYRSGAIKNMPEITNYGLMCILGTVVPGLLIGT